MTSLFLVMLGDTGRDRNELWMTIREVVPLFRKATHPLRKVHALGKSYIGIRVLNC
jgi:hypothetical protein